VDEQGKTQEIRPVSGDPQLKLSQRASGIRFAVFPNQEKLISIAASALGCTSPHFSEEIVPRLLS
jgi:hypothetical protein